MRLRCARHKQLQHRLAKQNSNVPQPAPSSPPTPAPQKSIYAHSAFLAFIAARLLAVFATQVQAVVVAWQVYDLTRSPMALAYVGLAQFLPMLVLLLPAGDLIDRFARKPILAAAWGVGAICSALLWWLSGHGAAGVNGIYAVLVLFGCTRAFSGPALQSLLPQIVAREQLAQAIAANSMIMRGAAIGGPFLGGVLYALGGGELTYAICFACLLLGSALLIWLVPVKYAGPPAPTQGTMSERFGAGIRFIRSRPIILGTISLDLFAVLLGGVVALLPIYAHEVLHVGPQGLGALRSAMAIGEVSAGLYLSMRPFNSRVGRTMFIAVAIFGVANLVFALSTVYIVSFIALMIAGSADMVSVYIRGALVQFSTPDHMRGRVNAVNMLFIGSSNELGEFRAGTSAAWLSAVPAAVLGGVCTLAVVGLWSRIFPTLRDVDKFEEAALPGDQ
ncbi:MFS transporter [Diaphorobacter aerolatus]|uniref:MFS transporter n=1 Tax=Diaphorobacter aerolatus TaxID=1288495 RepID=A0A7H0GM60_9BURK|nr:MFS transporter [Diaphorobacter aerolatus]QNP49376.1 MFS transporter [Diaphorobacter aerolatus]